MEKIKTHRDLLIYQKACLLVREILKILRDVKKDFISWNIIRQIVNSASSIRSNIVEGYYSHYGKSFASYLEISRGSTGETEDWFSELCEEGYVSKQTYDKISKDCQELIMMFNSFIKTIYTKENAKKKN